MYFRRRARWPGIVCSTSSPRQMTSSVSDYNMFGVWSSYLLNAFVPGRKAKPTYSREQRASRAHIIYAVCFNYLFPVVLALAIPRSSQRMGHCDRELLQQSHFLFTQTNLRFWQTIITRIPIIPIITFQKFDINKTGHITKENFIHVCKTDPQIMESISALYTILPG